MKLSEIIEKIDKTQTNHASFDEVSDACNLPHSYDIDYDLFESLVTAYYFVKWYCTDTWVGGKIWFVGDNDNPVAISMQTARKNKVKFNFLSKEAYLLLKETSLHCMKLEKETDNIAFADLDEEWGDHYSVLYPEELLVKTGYYNGQLVKLHRERFNYDTPSEEWHMINITLPDGEIKRVNLKEIKLPYLLNTPYIPQ
jgi:hypothetical protein